MKGELLEQHEELSFFSRYHPEKPGFGSRCPLCVAFAVISIVNLLGGMMTNDTETVPQELLGDLETTQVSGETAADIRGGEDLAGTSEVFTMLSRAIDSAVTAMGESLSRIARQ